MSNSDFTPQTDSDQPIMKYCANGELCIHSDGPYLSLDEFHNDKRRPDGHVAICKPCACAKTRKWNKDNAEYVSGRMAQYYIDNAEKIKARSKAKYWADPESKKEYGKQYHIEHREEANARNREYALNHREERDARVKAWLEARPERRKEIANKYAKSEKGRLANLRRRARKESLPDTLTIDEWIDCLEYFDYGCAYCGSTEHIHADHFIALADPDCPGTIATNIVPACKSHNSSKQHHKVEVWIFKKFSELEAHEILSRIGAYFDLVG